MIFFKWLVQIKSVVIKYAKSNTMIDEKIMSHWDILGIAKTNDERAIRKAYAVVLKTIDQENEPEKFIELRQALEDAKNEAYYVSLEETESVFAAQEDADNAIATETILANENDAITDTLALSPDKTPLHQSGFEFLVTAIQQQNSDIDLRKELVSYVDYILTLETDILSHAQAQAYLDQLHQACIDAGLSGLNDFLNLKQSNPALTDADSLNTEDTGSHYIQNTEQQYKNGLDNLCKTLWDENFDDDTYALFSHFLTEWKEQTLDIQMLTYDQLIYVLGSIRDESDQPKRFFKLWYECFGNEVPPVSADHAIHRLHDRIEYILKAEGFWQHTPEPYIDALQQLQSPQPFRPFKMWRLLLSKNDWIKSIRHSNWSNIPDMLMSEKNTNLHYLRIMTHWKIFLPVQLIFSLMCLMIASALFKLEALTILTVWLPLSLLYFPIFIGFIIAKTFTSSDGYNTFLRLTTTCYLSIIILGLVSPMINNTVISILLCAWLVLATFVMSYALYTSPSIFSSFPEAMRIQADKFFTWIGLGLVVSLVGFIVIINTNETITPFNLIFVLLPILFILLPSYFKEFFTQIFKAPSQIIINLLKPLQSSSFAMVFGIVVLYSALSLMAGSAKAQSLQDYINLPLTLTLIGCFWLAFIPSKIIAYICKYAAYLAGLISCIIWLSSGKVHITIITLWIGYFTYKTLREDWMLKAFLKQQT
jgi:hypothetical protein